MHGQCPDKRSFIFIYFFFQILLRPYGNMHVVPGVSYGLPQRGWRRTRKRVYNTRQGAARNGFSPKGRVRV